MRCRPPEGCDSRLESGCSRVECCRISSAMSRLLDSQVAYCWSSVVCNQGVVPPETRFPSHYRERDSSVRGGAVLDSRVTWTSRRLSRANPSVNLRGYCTCSGVNTRRDNGSRRVSDPLGARRFTIGSEGIIVIVPGCYSGPKLDVKSWPFDNHESEYLGEFVVGTVSSAAFAGH